MRHDLIVCLSPFWSASRARDGSTDFIFECIFEIDMDLARLGVVFGLISLCMTLSCRIAYADEENDIKMEEVKIEQDYLHVKTSNPITTVWQKQKRYNLKKPFFLIV